MPPAPRLISGVMIQVAMAAATTKINEIALFWTTESMVIRRVSPGAWVGEPVPQVAGSP